MRVEPLPERLTGAELATLRDLLATKPTWHELAKALESEAASLSSHALRMLSMAFVYDLLDADQVSQRANVGGPYASMYAGPEGTFPPPPAESLPEVLAVWRSTLAMLDAPIVTARLADLLYVATGKPAHADGRAGAHAHLALARDASVDALDRGRSLHRALEVLAELNDQEALKAAVGDAVTVVDDLLEQEHAGPPFIALRALMALRPRSRPGDLDSLLDRVIERFSTEPRHLDTALGYAERAATTPARRDALRRQRVAARVDDARRAEGIRKVHSLQRAIKLARDYGLGGEADELLRELQEIPHDDLGFASLQTSVDLPTVEIARMIDAYVGSHARDVFDALERFGSIDPPGGSDADVDADVAETNKGLVFQQLFGQQVFGAATSSPVFIANEPESKHRLARGQRRRMQTNFFSSVLFTPMLFEAARLHGRPQHDQLADHFATKLIGAERGERIARALELFWDKDFDASAHVLAPRLESIIRDLARHRGVTIVTPPREGVYAGLIPLGRLIDKLRDLDPDDPWWDYLYALLCDPLADNL